MTKKKKSPCKSRRVINLHTKFHEVQSSFHSRGVGPFQLNKALFPTYSGNEITTERGGAILLQRVSEC
jgi:hypothetical protein